MRLLDRRFLVLWIAGTAIAGLVQAGFSRLIGPGSPIPQLSGVLLGLALVTGGFAYQLVFSMGGFGKWLAQGLVLRSYVPWSRAWIIGSTAGSVVGAIAATGTGFLFTMEIAIPDPDTSWFLIYALGFTLTISIPKVFFVAVGQWVLLRSKVSHASLWLLMGVLVAGPVTFVGWTVGQMFGGLGRLPVVGSLTLTLLQDAISASLMGLVLMKLMNRNMLETRLSQNPGNHDPA